MPSFIKKEPKDGTITESSKKSSKKEIRYYYSIPKSSYLVKENSKANGKDRTPSSTHHHMAQSRYKMMMGISSKLTVSISNFSLSLLTMPILIKN